MFCQSVCLHSQAPKAKQARITTAELARAYLSTRYQYTNSPDETDFSLQQHSDNSSHETQHSPTTQAAMKHLVMVGACYLDTILK